jgi:hypothetical protein
MTSSESCFNPARAVDTEQVGAADRKTDDDSSRIWNDISNLSIQLTPNRSEQLIDRLIKKPRFSEMRAGFL